MNPQRNIDDGKAPVNVNPQRNIDDGNAFSPSPTAQFQKLGWHLKRKK